MQIQPNLQCGIEWMMVFTLLPPPHPHFNTHLDCKGFAHKPSPPGLPPLSLHINISEKHVESQLVRWTAASRC